MKRVALRALAVVIGVGALLVASGGAASAHPLGNFTVNRYSGLVVSSDAVTVEHVLDLAEIPTAQRTPAIDADGDGRLGKAELTPWAARECAATEQTLRLSVAGERVPFTVTKSSAETTAGQASLPILRLDCVLRAVATVRGDTDVEYVDTAATDQVGWREVTARGNGVTLLRSNVPARSTSHALTSYPQDLLASPLDVRGAVLHVRPGGPALVDDATGASTGVGRVVGGVTGSFQGLATKLRRQPAGRPYRAAGGTGPRRGPRGRARPRQDDHGVLPVRSSARSAPRGDHRRGHGDGDAHGRRSRAGGAGQRRQRLRAGPHLPLAHRALRRIGRGRRRSPCCAPRATVTPTRIRTRTTTRTRIRTTTRTDNPHPHDHPHADQHPHPHGHPHPHPEHARITVASAPANRACLVALAPETHDHAAEDQSSAPGRRGLIAMGLAGGLLPSPSAVLVFLGALAVGHPWFGVALVVAFGLGMATTLAVVGVLVMRLRERVERRLSSRPGARAAAVLRVLPVLTAVTVTALGLLLALKGVGSLDA